MLSKEVIGPQTLSPVVTQSQARQIAKEFGTPTYVYSQEVLEQQATKALAFPNDFGLTVRYAMKANPNKTILKIFNNKGIYIDASSGYEVERARAAGIPGERVLLTSQQSPHNLRDLLKEDIEYNACSFLQLRSYGKLSPSSNVSVRINPGAGSGHNNRTNTGGPSSSFGIWHEDLSVVFNILNRYDLDVQRIHTHIGSGSNPEVWQEVAKKSLDIFERFWKAGFHPKILNLGGGYKVGRMGGEESTDLQKCGKPVKRLFGQIAARIPTKPRLEIEPGTYLVANAGCLIAGVNDLKSTPNYRFIITDTGMTEVTRPALYGAQHPISVVPTKRTNPEFANFIVSGHCCESGDILTPAKDDPEALQERKLLSPEVGDLIVVGGTGAYCSSMSTANYNSFPRAAEVLLDNNLRTHLIRKRESLENITNNELEVQLNYAEGGQDDWR
jgi:diaminopimelate decarboxylase